MVTVEVKGFLEKSSTTLMLILPVCAKNGKVLMRKIMTNLNFMELRISAIYKINVPAERDAYQTLTFK